MALTWRRPDESIIALTCQSHNAHLSLVSSPASEGALWLFAGWMVTRNWLICRRRARTSQYTRAHTNTRRH